MAKKRRAVVPKQQGIVPEWVTRDVSVSTWVKIKSIFHTRLVINSTPSGERYEFEPGEVKEVLLEDTTYLLSLIYEQSTCCGGVTPQPIHYFEEI